MRKPCSRSWWRRARPVDRGAAGRWTMGVVFTSGLGLRHEDCAVEIPTDGARGVRITRPRTVSAGATVRESIWIAEFSASTKPERAVVFCPIDSAHRSPPWGIVIERNP